MKDLVTITIETGSNSERNKTLGMLNEDLGHFYQRCNGAEIHVDSINAEHSKILETNLNRLRLWGGIPVHKAPGKKIEKKPGLLQKIKNEVMQGLNGEL